MRIICGVLILTALVISTAASNYAAISAAQQPAPSPSPQPSVVAAPQQSPNQEINNRFVQQHSERIKGQENEPAERVFKNIQIQGFKNLPAGRLLLIMNRGYSRALGVNCTHCHVEQDFASDEKRPKLAAREMAAMHRMINEQLKQMKNLKSAPDDRFINCSTCHRGGIDPVASDR
jgi:Photosynthetic reaction centre cytochrome C subunit